MSTKKPVIIEPLFGELEIGTNGKKWQVAHTKPQCEKKIAEYARLNNVIYYLPQITVKHTYLHKQVNFTKPMFRGYIFLQADQVERQTLVRCGMIVNYLKVNDEHELLSELKAIHAGTQKKAEFHPTVWLSKGLEVEITVGPLQGVRGVVESHDKLGEIRLQVNMLRQAIMVKVPFQDVKIIGEYEVVD